MKRFVSGRPYWWQWFTILSLDAASVAVAWQIIFARVAQAEVGFPEIAVLGASVWLAYTADRWIEALRLKPTEIFTQRHSFAVRWRWPILGVWCIVLVADLAIAFQGLTSREIEAGVILLTAVAGYLLSHQLWHRDRPWRLPKELCVALLITGGVLLFLVTDPRANLRALPSPAIHFATLCFINCLLISFWEREVDVHQGQQSIALTPKLKKAFHLVPFLPWALALECLVIGLLGQDWNRRIFLCLAGSAALLGAIDRLEDKIGRQLARVLADVVLLTPFLALFR